MGSEAFWSRIERKLTAMDPEGLGSWWRAIEQESMQLAWPRSPVRRSSSSAQKTALSDAADEPSGIIHAVRVTITDAAHSPQLRTAGLAAAVRDHLVRVRAVRVAPRGC
jgi:hypothetical protein